METIKLPAVLDDVKERKDWSSRITFDSRELTEEEFLILRRFKGEEGWLMFSKNVLDKEDIPEHDAEVEQKTISQRCRSALFVLWKSRGEPDTFRIFYERYMEAVLDGIKKKID